MVSLLVSEVVGSLINWPHQHLVALTENSKMPFIWHFQPLWLSRLLMNKPVETRPTLVGCHVLLSTWVLIAFIVSSAYQGVLTSMLVAPKFEIPVDSMEDLVNYGKMPWVVERGTEFHQYLKEATSGVRKKILDGAGYISYSYYEKERMKEEKFAILTDRFSMKIIMSDDYSKTGKCHYYIAKEEVLTLIGALAFPKGSPLIPHFNKWIIRLKQAGLLEKYQSDSTINATACMVSPGKGEKTVNLVLSLQEMGGVFILFLGDVADNLCQLLSKWKSLFDAVTISGRIYINVQSTPVCAVLQILFFKNFTVTFYY
ncbi:hypothetical protein SK128_019859 [Halocaridina rubra]|uniref:Ionotropic glutamate receptor C-terminal domain-containing protein n=1 Tax=Halocaridina rubra TaxID=373956 RepID=A0AAN8XEW3_HALRR